MQRQAISDRRLLLIGGKQVGGLLTVSETGYENAPIEVPELGYIRLISSSNKKIKQLDLTYLIKRDSATYKYFMDWEKEGGFARDVTMYFTDKSGDITNSNQYTIFTDCELGNFVDPAFDEGAITKKILTISLYPYMVDRVLI